VKTHPPLVTRENSADPSSGKEFTFDDGSVPVSALSYSPASVVSVGNAKFVYISGHTGTDPAFEAPADEAGIADAVKHQTTGTLAKIGAILHRLGGSLADITRLQVFVSTELTKPVFEAIHAARRAHFHGDRMPASTLVRVSALIRPGALIEIDADAVIVAKDTPGPDS
jgi:enamine deaminase RidA (YjgF/YER057c/UK114 family)